nr:dynein light chain [Hymenolepis microstoma]
MSYVKAKVHQTDMKEVMQQEVVDVCARIMCRPEVTPVKVATEIRQYFDERYGGSWTCIVGRDFSSSFAHEKKKLISLNIGGQQVLLFKGS